jgi:hypothetical protein
MAGEGRAQTRGMRNQTRRGFFLHGLGDERNPFCILTWVKTDGGRLATSVRFRRPLSAVTGSFGGPPATRTGWTDSSRPLSCSSVLQFLRAVMNWTHTARNPWWLVFGACRTKFYEYEPLFIGLLGPTRRGDGVLHFLSINQTLIQLRLEYFWSGMNFGLVTIWKPSSRLGLHRLRKIPYLESGHRVWSG